MERQYSGVHSSGEDRSRDHHDQSHSTSDDERRAAAGLDDPSNSLGDEAAAELDDPSNSLGNEIHPHRRKLHRVGWGESSWAHRVTRCETAPA